MGPVEKILLVGDYAKGTDTGVIDVVLVGKALNTEYIGVEDKIENLIDRKVNFFLATKPETNRESIVLY